MCGLLLDEFLHPLLDTVPDVPMFVRPPPRPIRETRYLIRVVWSRTTSMLAADRLPPPVLQRAGSSLLKRI